MSFLSFYHILSGLFSVSYIYIIARYIGGWKSLLDWEIPSSFQPSTKVSVLIPARNEEARILDCLQSVCNQHYPESLFEIILLDDHSTDETVAIALALDYPNLKVISLSDFLNENEVQSFKKKAIEIGIQQSVGNLIVTTDADCIVDENWLNYLVSYYENHKVKFIAAPVNFHLEKNLFEKFQSLDFLGMMCITGAGINKRFMNMCNGANLAYEKKVFYEVSGFSGIDNMASGDDMMLMQKVAARFPDQIGFVKNINARTLTNPQPTLAGFIQQRIRWASKSSSYREWKVTFILAMVFFFCNSIVFGFILIPFFGWAMGSAVLIQVLIKALMDYFFLKEISTFFQRKDLMDTFIPSFFMHIFYIVGIGWLANLKKEYYWKGRKVR